MLISVDEVAFSAGATAEVTNALERAVMVSKLGVHRVVVSPQALVRGAAVGLGAALLEDLVVLQRGWLEGQALLRKASRSIILAGAPAEDGIVSGSGFHVFAGNAMAAGIFREPTFVTESMRADGRLLKLYMECRLELTGVELRRTWYARPDQGGGATLFAAVERYADDPHPALVVADRDSDAFPACGQTADRCIGELRRRALFPDRDAALAGGFSGLRPNLAFRVLGARSIENLIFPHVSNLFFQELMADHVGAERLGALKARYPRFPELTGAEARNWLGVNMKRFPEYGDAELLGSRSIERLCEWADASATNRERLCAALATASEIEEFQEPLDSIVGDLWSLGLRSVALL